MPRSRPRARKPSARRAIVLVIVLVVVVILSLTAYTFSDLMITHQESVQLSGRQMQATALVDSGIDLIRIFLLNDPATQEEIGGHFDNPAYFQAVNVLPEIDPRFRGNVTILAPALDQEGNLGGVRYGLEDESTRLNVNTLILADDQLENGGRTLLMALPGMTEDVADAIMDWLDEDDEPREFGCELEYYTTLNPPYAPKNGPLNSLEELLLVRGVAPQLLFGMDMNRNGVVDPHELESPFSGDPTQSGTPAGSAAAGSQTSGDAGDPAVVEGSMDRGWSGYLTMFSQERNLTQDGLERIHLNQEDMQTLSDQLREVFNAEWANFIVAYRQNGPAGDGEQGEGGQQGGGQSGEGELDLTQPGKFPITQVLDLIGVSVQAKFQGSGQTVTLKSPFSEEILAMNGYLPALMDNITVNPSPTIPGRINCNQASRTILAGVPGMTPEILDRIMEARANEETEEQPRNSETWLLTSGIVTLDEMRLLYPFLNAGGSVYRAQVVGYFEDGGASARAEVVIDSSGATPRILFLRDISHLGRGYPMEILGVPLFDNF